MAKTSFKTNPISLKTLLQSCEQGKIQLPDFQRSWVSEEDRIKSLIAPVSRGFPMGALMALESRADGDAHQKATANTFDNFSLAMRQTISDLMVDRIDQNQAIVTKYLDQEDFRSVAFQKLAKAIYEEIRKEPQGQRPRV